MKKRIGILGSIILLVGLGVFSWFWWQNRDNTPQTKPNTFQQPSDPSEGGKYLVIKEWGVRFELPADFRGDIYYYLDPTQNVVTFGSRKLEKTEPLCSAQKFGLAFGIARMSSSSQKRAYETDPFTTIGKYKYQLVPSSVGCNQNNTLSREELHYSASAEPDIEQSVTETLKNY